MSIQPAKARGEKREKEKDDQSELVQPGQYLLEVGPLVWTFGPTVGDEPCPGVGTVWRDLGSKSLRSHLIDNH